MPNLETVNISAKISGMRRGILMFKLWVNYLAQLFVHAHREDLLDTAME